jgi:dynein heavy chain, axonemal
VSAAKVLGNDIAEKQAAAAKTEAEIDEARVGYQPCGDYTSILFFAISDLAAIDPMYQYSLPWFISLFVSSVKSAPPSEYLEERLKNIHDNFTYALYCNVCRSLFEKDKLLFAFLLASRILESQGQIVMEEWQFLLTGGLGSVGADPNPAPGWLVDRGWKEILKLSKLVSFAGLSDAVAEVRTTYMS